MQCHTAQFSWKIIFCIERCQHEIILSACSEKEEEVWKSQVGARLTAEAVEYCEGRRNAPSNVAISRLDIKAIGLGYGAFPNFSRRASIQRAATLGQKSSLQQVVIKNTEAQKYTGSSSSASMMRSHSHMSPNNIKILAPRRVDRSKLESAVADVWTRSLLPYPGMGGRRGDHHIRASANSVMRKLSMASIASNFSKRSLSYSTLSSQRTENGRATSSVQSSEISHACKIPEKRKRPVVVDFHTAPDAFLPEDFELNIKTPKPPIQQTRKLISRLSVPGSDSILSSSGSPKPPVEAKPLIMPATDTIRSRVAVVFDDGGQGVQAEAPVRSNSLEISYVDSTETVAVAGRPATSSGETPSKKPSKPRKGFFKIFG